MVGAAVGEVAAPRHTEKDARQQGLTAPAVTIVIPARDAAGTLAETLTSVKRQTMPRWEAIIIDDGSTDATLDIAACHAASDARIRLFRQPALGVCAARNRGVAAARAEWLLFLDADDALTPDALERLLGVAQEDSSFGAVHGGWARVAPDGAIIEEGAGDAEGDLFELLARYSAFPVHAVLVRRALVQAAGGWDTALTHCEDWDLYQRIARMGVRFGAARQRVALYHTRSGTASANALSMLADGLRVLRRGHARDARVCSPSPRHANGRDISTLEPDRFY
ncbi:MAG: glycosyltransferase family 2 protein, partial [Longimicrobiales bacterium]